MYVCGHGYIYVCVYPAVGLQLEALQPRQHLQGAGDVPKRVSPPGRMQRRVTADTEPVQLLVSS